MLACAGYPTRRSNSKGVAGAKNNLFFGVTKETESNWTKIIGVKGEKVLLFVTNQKQAYFCFPNLEKVCWLLTLYMKSAWSTLFLLGARETLDRFAT